jgi:alpha-galactosidase
LIVVKPSACLPVKRIHAILTRLTFFIGVVLSLAAAIPARAASTTVAESGDASISHDVAGGTWALIAGGTTLTLNLDPSRDFAIVKLATVSSRAWTVGTLPDTTVRVGGRTLLFGSRIAGFTYAGASAKTVGSQLQLDAAFDLRASNLRVTRHYAIVSGSPTFETWTTFQAEGSAAAVSDVNGLQLSVPNGAMHYVTGLSGDNADVESDSAFTLERKALASGESLVLGGSGRSSEKTVPWLAVDGPKDEFFTALMWSGSWALTASRSASTLGITLGLAPMTTRSAGRTFDGPHALFGVVPGGLAQASAALRAYVLDGIRAGRQIAPLVTYNTWFAYGVEIDDASMRAEMDRAAAIGVEQFVVDAGWYAGAGAAGPMDFDSGVGGWTADPARFPDGLAPLTEYAHSLGMRFGLWVEPERVNMSIVGDSGVDEEWLATNGGEYGSDHAAQICFASDAGRQWVVDRLTALLDEVQPDYLKWDNNMWVNCDRESHGHGDADGNFAHVSALYDVLAMLRDRYPDMAIENVSGGGNRLDLGMVRYTDAAWMDDRTAPSVHVRHNLEGLSAVFPPAYLLSFVTEHDTEPLHDAPDMPLYFRSRMAGALGLCFKVGDMEESAQNEMSRQIAIYKNYRGTLAAASAALLTRQATSNDGGPAWDVLQEAASDGQALLVYAVQNDSSVAKVNVKPTGLDPDTIYEVQSVDVGVLGSATGSDLMRSGIDVLQSPVSAAHILFITVQQ